ncbi:hypothetical protein GCM10027343_23850 [Noviherbaspirillum agri]
MNHLRAALCILGLFLTLPVLAQQDPYPLPSKDWPKPVMDDQTFAFVLFDRFEYRAQRGKDVAMWDVQGWFGGDHNKLWLKTEGEGERGEGVDQAEAQVLYARRISPYWHLQAGVRQEARPRPSRNSAVIAVQGLAPYWFDMEAMAFIRGGEVTGRLEFEYDQLLTQRVILQPRIETVFSSKAEPERGVGRGLNHVELGLRLRYEIRREFAPYIGINWTRRLGDTADLARQQSKDVGETAIVFGLRAWY